MNIIKRYSISHFVIFCISVFSFVMCSKEENSEISNEKNVISCRYVGLAERNGQPIVELIFKNKTGKNLKSVFGGLRIIKKNGEVVQRTGFTYSRPFKADEEKNIPAFAYIEIKDEALKILSSATDFIPMVFELSEVVFENGQSVKF